MNSHNNGTDIIDLDDDSLLFALRDIAIQAGEEAVRLRNNGLTTEIKDDRSPVTNADKAANKIICDALQTLAPAIPIISEENVDAWPEIETLKSGYYWLIDPIDGTTPFANNEDEFTINIALMKDERPILGIIDAPKMEGGITFMGVCDGENQRAYKQPHGGDIGAIHTSSVTVPDKIKTIMSHRAFKGNDTLPEGFAQPDFMPSSYKFCVLADGSYDAVAGFGPTSEWDIAAGHAIVKAAGGDVKQALGGEFRYNKPIAQDKPRYENPAFIAVGDNVIEHRVREFAKQSEAKSVPPQSHSR